MHVAILGCGSLGGVMAARLAEQPDFDLTVIDRDPRIVEAIGRNGLILRQGKRARTFSVRLVEEAQDLCFDALILATKAGSLLEAATRLKDNLAPQACVITVQNGLAALDLIDAVGADLLVPGCVLWGASMESPGEYRITNSGSFIVGGLGQTGVNVTRAQALLSRVFPVTVSNNIRGVLWSKLAITTTFTTLGAITGLSFGKLAASREIRNIMLRIGRELIEVGRAEGITFEPLTPALNIERFLSDQGYSRALKHLLIRILGYKNRHDQSSMLDSLRQGRKTEIEFINGRLVQSADRTGLAVPYNRLAVDLIREMEEGRRQAARENLAVFRSLD
ncbi:MAG: 2-dehydropantoate 2-reductase [Spirochaetaceae bacterium]|nr:MAG: 2-dehydropantoate 2-reductase [Spirochaetaceae bacterium]